MGPQSNQRGIETADRGAVLGVKVPGLNRTSVGLKLWRPSTPVPTWTPPQSNQRGIETHRSSSLVPVPVMMSLNRTSVGLKHMGLDGLLEASPRRLNRTSVGLKRAIRATMEGYRIGLNRTSVGLKL